MNHRLCENLFSMRYIVRRNAYSLGLSLIAAREPVHLSQVQTNSRDPFGSQPSLTCVGCIVTSAEICPHISILCPKLHDNIHHGIYLIASEDGGVSVATSVQLWSISCLSHLFASIWVCNLDMRTLTDSQIQGIVHPLSAPDSQT